MRAVAESDRRVSLSLVDDEGCFLVKTFGRMVASTYMSYYSIDLASVSLF